MDIEDALRRHGFDAAGVEAFMVTEAEIQRRERAKKKAKPVPQIPLDFGDWNL